MTIFFLRDREINVVDFRSGSIKLMGEGGGGLGTYMHFLHVPGELLFGDG